VGWRGACVADVNTVAVKNVRFICIISFSEVFTSLLHCITFSKRVYCRVINMVVGICSRNTTICK